MEIAVETLKRMPGRKKITWTLEGGPRNIVGMGDFTMNDNEMISTTWRRVLIPWRNIREGAKLTLKVHQTTDRMDEETKLPVTIVSHYIVTSAGISNFVPLGRDQRGY